MRLSGASISPTGAAPALDAPRASPGASATPTTIEPGSARKRGRPKGSRNTPEQNERVAEAHRRSWADPDSRARREHAAAVRSLYARVRWSPILDLWAAGRTSGEIATVTGISRNSICRIVQQARHSGDERAVARRAPRMLAKRA